MGKKSRWFILVIFLLLCSTGYVLSLPPSPPNIVLNPPAPKCTVTNGGVEICDNKDNDCDKLIDEYLNTTSGCNQVGYCYGAYKTCSAGNWSVCSKLPGSETCNAVDDDCNGPINNGLPNINVNTPCNVTGAYGVCRAGLRYQFCDAGVTAYTWTSCTSYILSSQEKCNSLDDDCDNIVDENLTNSSGCNQVGFCAGSFKTCSSGGWSGVCSKVPIAETCNNVDDNCNGYTDENLINSSGCNQVGFCAGSFKTCSAGGWSVLCSKVPIAETCNNVDDDCNGVTDDGVTRTTTCGLGRCAGNKGIETCVAGQFLNSTNTCDSFAGAITEICEGANDDDCDGTVDNGCACTAGSIKSCGTSNKGECKLGNHTCNDGVWGSVCVGAVNPKIEVCDGLDNDCDGNIDENLTDASNCSQLGLCTGSFKTCSAGNWSSCSINPITEICNNLDDDCNGVIDNGVTNLSGCNQLGLCAGSFKTCSMGGWSGTCSKVPLAETCNSIDDDCDDEVDEGNVCYVPPTTVNPGAGGGGGSSSRPPATIGNTSTANNNNNASSVPAVNSNASDENPREIIANNSLVEIIPLGDKVQNLSSSKTNNELYSIFRNFSLTKIIIVGVIFAGIIGFLYFFIVHYARKRRLFRRHNLKEMQYPDALHPRAGTQELDNLQANFNRTETSRHKSNISMGLTVQEINTLKYINAMRQKGFNNDYIANQLRLKGWKEEFIYKLIMYR